jgi:hypothetical protein
VSADRQAADKEIADILAKHGEVMTGSVWRVQGNAVIHHKTLERIAVKVGIRYRQPHIIRSEEKEAVILVTGVLGDHEEWSIGEANIGLNYRVTGNQAGYPYAMAEKRAKDRVILKLIGLHGVLYSDQEADEFRNSESGSLHAGEAVQSPEPAKPAAPQPVQKPEGWVQTSGYPAADEIASKVGKEKSVNAITDLMLLPETQKILNELPPALRDRVRDYARTRLHALGWPTKKAA